MPPGGKQVAGDSPVHAQVQVFEEAATCLPHRAAMSLGAHAGSQCNIAGMACHPSRLQYFASVRPHPYCELQRQPLHRPVQRQQLLSQLLAVRSTCNKGRQGRAMSCKGMQQNVRCCMLINRALIPPNFTIHASAAAPPTPTTPAQRTAAPHPPHSLAPSCSALLMAARASPYALMHRSKSDTRASRSPPAPAASTSIAPSSSACSSCTRRDNNTQNERLGCAGLQRPSSKRP